MRSGCPEYGRRLMFAKLPGVHAMRPPSSSFRRPLARASLAMGGIRAASPSFLGDRRRRNIRLYRRTLEGVHRKPERGGLPLGVLRRKGMEGVIQRVIDGVCK